MFPGPGRPKPESTLPKLGRLLIPGEMPGLELIEGELILGRETDGRLISGLELPPRFGMLPVPSEGRESEGLGLGRVVGRLLTLGSEGRLDGTFGREMFGLGRETLGLGRDMPPPLGRDPPPIPMDGLAPPPRPPGLRPCADASETSTQLVAPANTMPRAMQ